MIMHRALSTYVPAAEARTHVPLTVENLLQRGEFVPCSRAGLGIEFKTGDQLLIRKAGYFAVRLYLPYRNRQALVWMGRFDGQQLVWGKPSRHPNDYLAALDALKLVASFTYSTVAGD